MALPTMKKSNGLAAALQETQVQATAGGGGVFCKFDYKTGDFLMGRESENIADEIVLIHTDSISHGWVLWSGNKATKVLVNFTEALPTEPEPVFTGKIDPRTKQEIVDYASEGRAIMFATDDGLQVTLEGSSYGVRKGVDAMLKDIKARAFDPINADYLYPKVKLESESYEKAGVRDPIHNPIFTIVAWCDVDGNEQGETPKLAAVPDEAPVEEEQVEEPVAEAAPKRRRRKSA